MYTVVETLENGKSKVVAVVTSKKQAMMIASESPARKFWKLNNDKRGG